MCVRITPPTKSVGRLRARWRAAMAIVVLAATPVGCGTSSRTARPTTTTAPGLSGGVELHYTETPIELESGTLAPTADGVWVYPHLDAVAFHLTPAGVVDRRATLPDYGSVASDQGDVWAVHPLNQPALFHLDAGDLQPQQRWSDLPIEDPLVGFGSGWASGQDGRLYRARPGQPDVQAYETGGLPWPWLGLTDTSVWTLGGTHLQRIDPVTGVITDESTLLGLAPGPVKGMGAAGKYVVLSTGDHLHIIDPDARRLVGTVDPPAGFVVVSWYAAIDAGNGRFWVGLAPEEWGVEVDIPRGTPSPDTFLLLVDACSAHVMARVTTPFPEDFEPAADGGLWVSPLRQKRVLHVSAAEVPG